MTTTATAAAGALAASPAASLPPGFRFHPTDEELILHYLRNRAAVTPCPVAIIAEVDIYKFDPWDLPAKAIFGDGEWYFFSPRERKYPNGIRPNRAAASGYWKATGTDKPIHSSSGGANENIGVKKALVFYRGRPPKGLKTNWIMHEYRLADAASSSNCYRPLKLRDSSMKLDDWVLCRIYKKSNTQQSPEPTPLPEMEDSGAEDNTSQNHIHPFQELNGSMPQLQKSFSVSDFFEDYNTIAQLFDNPPDLFQPTGLEGGSFMGEPIVKQQQFSNGINYGQFPPSTAAAATDNYLKRQRSVVDEANATLPQPSKKRSVVNTCNFTSLAMGNQFEITPQYNMMGQQPLFSQQLLNSHLDLH